MIRREDVADLQPGDVVEVTSTDWPEGTAIRGPLWMSDGETLQVAATVVRHWDGRHPFNQCLSLTVISRAPRPLYVNHDRIEPVAGDVVRDADSDHALALYIYAPSEDDEPWWLDTKTDWISPAEMRGKRLRLLVDGATGQAVQ